MKLESRVQRLENIRGRACNALIFLEPGESTEQARAKYEAAHNVKLENVLFISWAQTVKPEEPGE
jgi:hypothetical protein